MPDAILERTETIDGCPKYCTRCGNQGMVIDSRRRPYAVMRAYRCRCGHRWSTAETLLEDGPSRHDPQKFKHHQQREARKAVTQLRAQLHEMIDTFFEARKD